MPMLYSAFLSVPAPAQHLPSDVENTHASRPCRTLRRRDISAFIPTACDNDQLLIGTMQLHTATAAVALLLLCLSQALAASPPDVSVLATDSLVNARRPQQQQRQLSLRRLQSRSQFFTLRPQCSWEQGACAPMLSNWNMYPGTPSSPYRR
jgi:hypothetical protein